MMASTEEGRGGDPRLAWRILPDLLALLSGLAIAWFMDWETRDLVWSLWLCSLVIGYVSILTALGAGGYFGMALVGHPGFKAEHRVKAIISGAVGGVFLLGFFSLHFCGFHAGHSVFLHHFFPIEGMPQDGFGEAFMNPPLLWVLVFRHLMVPFGIFLVPALIAERKQVFGPWGVTVRKVREIRADAEGVNPALGSQEGREAASKDLMGNAMARPYINVVRMHLLIFFFAIAYALKVDDFLVYAVVYFVYFTPWRELQRVWDKRREQA